MTELKRADITIEDVRNEIRAALNEFSKSLDVRFDHIETRIDRIETRIDHIETRIDHIETRIEKGYGGCQSLSSWCSKFTNNVQCKSCSICLNKLSSIKYIPCVTPCDHYFHYNCLKQWCRRSPSCPVCRKLIPYFHFRWRFLHVCIQVMRFVTLKPPYETK